MVLNRKKLTFVFLIFTLLFSTLLPMNASAAYDDGVVDEFNWGLPTNYQTVSTPTFIVEAKINAVGPIKPITVDVDGRSFPMVDVGNFMHQATVSLAGLQEGVKKITLKVISEKYGIVLIDASKYIIYSTYKGTLRFDTLARAVDEGSGKVTVNVVRTGSSSGVLRAQYRTTTLPKQDALAGKDFIANSGLLTFSDGETVKSIQIQLVNDSTKEPLLETFSLQLLPEPYTNSSIDPNYSSTTVVIRDND
ncbi:Calx-beta domain-containing protein [Paenibacillus sedimenti]|uniref:Calx-beta domain-containing protein n=1 Tax=Paenibacillus sedimenti TaxID=2770274 RepID=A0A926QIL9_9BACL|nr:Calx-beta domain-containing protein [Paenibacillus sedimenti]MBD0379753.1 hypothetical protein [Paenibacillus sedimenti]